MADNSKAKSNGGDNKPVITPEAMLSYPHLFEPVQQEGKPKPEYSCCLVFAPDADLAKLKAACAAAAQGKWGEKASPMYKAGQLRFPFRTDAEEKGYPAGSTFINVKTTKRPEIVDGRKRKIEDEDDVYAGCFVRACLRAFAYEQSGNKGVSFALGPIQKLRDGERLGGTPRADDVFDRTEEDDEDPLDTTPATAPAEPVQAPAAAPAGAVPPPAPGDDPFA